MPNIVIWALNYDSWIIARLINWRSWLRRSRMTFRWFPLIIGHWWYNVRWVSDQVTAGRSGNYGGTKVDRDSEASINIYIYILFNRYFVQFLFVLHAIATNVKRGWVTCFSSSNLPGQHDPQFREVHSLLCCEAMDGQRMGTPSAWCCTSVSGVVRRSLCLLNTLLQVMGLPARSLALWP